MGTTDLARKLTPNTAFACFAAVRRGSPARDAKGLRGDGWRDTGVGPPGNLQYIVFCSAHNSNSSLTLLQNKCWRVAWLCSAHHRVASGSAGCCPSRVFPALLRLRLPTPRVLFGAYVVASLFPNRFVALKAPRVYLPRSEPCWHNTSARLLCPLMARRWCPAWEIFRDGTSKQRPSWRPRRPREPRNVPRNLLRVESVAGGGYGETTRGMLMATTAVTAVDFRWNGVGMFWGQEKPLWGLALQAHGNSALGGRNKAPEHLNTRR